MTNILIAGGILTVLSLLIATVFGSKTMHENTADLIAYLMFGAGFGCVIVWGLLAFILGVGK